MKHWTGFAPLKGAQDQKWVHVLERGGYLSLLKGSITGLSRCRQFLSSLQPSLLGEDCGENGCLVAPEGP